MSSDPAEVPCPYCGKPVMARAERCPHCGEHLDEEEPRPRRRRRPPPEPEIQPTDFLVPTNVSPWAMASCYMGFVGFCLPLVGLVFAIPGFICGIIAVRKRAKAASYGAVTSNIRAIIGLVLSSLAIVLYGGFLIAWAVTGFK